MSHVNSRIAQVEMLQAALEPGLFAVQGTEYVAEVHYIIQAAKGMLVRPNVQYVMTPAVPARTRML
jgi:carbohydrate-selective porin OprB